MRKITDWSVYNATNKSKNCFLFLPGRGSHGKDLCEMFMQAVQSSSLIVGITPEGRQWYPRPNGPNNQEDAIAGLKDSVKTVQSAVRTIYDDYGIPAHRIALVGFSAGAVMALQVGLTTKINFPVIVSFSGAILEPEKIPEPNTTTEFLLFHNQDDDVFGYKERFLPMEAGLRSKGHLVTSLVRPKGKHHAGNDDNFEFAKQFVQDRFEGVFSYDDAN